MSGVHFGHEHPALPVFRQAALPEGPLERVPAGARLGLALAIVAGTAIMPVRWWWWHVSVAALLIAVVVLAQLPWRPLLLRLAWLAPFVIGAALASLLHGPTGPSWWVIGLRGGLCLLTMLVLAATTDFGAQLAVLRRLHVPGLLVTTLVLMHRYVFVLGDEATRMRRARASRSFVRPNRPGWSLPAGIVGQLFVRASERAERIYLAMCARGWR